VKTYAKLRRLTEPRERDLDQTFQRLADSLRDSGKTATVRCTILTGDTSRRWTFDLRGNDCQLLSEQKKMPDLEIITSDSTWWEIAAGNVSPLEAFSQGRLRILGNTDLATHLLRVAGNGSGAVAICGG
jgi:hypothetical protein